MQWHACFSAPQNRFNGLCSFSHSITLKEFCLNKPQRTYSGIAFTFISDFSCCIFSVAGQIQFLSEASRGYPSKTAWKDMFPSVKPASEIQTHIMFRELSYHTSQTAIQRDGKTKLLKYFTSKIYYSVLF
jgi:hypothetical protein